MKSIIIFSVTLLFFAACGDSTVINPGDVNPTISEIPEIELLSINTTEIKQFTDSLVFTIKYIDGDGDLGTEDADEKTIEIIDNRDPSLIFEYHLSPRAPIGSEITIQGEIEVVLKNIILLDSSNSSETTTFSIRIKDRQINWSNTVTTQNVTILP